LELPSTIKGTLSYSNVGKDFISELYEQFGTVSNPQEINRRRLYGNMSTQEIQDIIRAKYPDNMTNRELYLMLSELDAVDVGGHMSGLKLNYSYMSLGIIDPYEMTQEEYTSRYTKMLNLQANPGFLAELYNLSTIRGSKFLLPTIKEILMRLFGAFELDNDLLDYDPANIFLGALEKNDNTRDA
jgi:hypothetical protein